MKLPIPTDDRERDLREFDIWITPSLGEITETDKFKDELGRIKTVIEALGAATNNFDDPSHCQGRAIAETFARIGARLPRAERAELFKSLASTLFLVTGKSDNNAKCQFPLYLRDVAKWSSMPRPGRNGGEKPGIPRVLKSDTYMDLVSALEDSADESRMLVQFIEFLLSDEAATRQFWAIGNSYFSLKALGKNYEDNLLSPCSWLEAPPLLSSIWCAGWSSLRECNG